MPNLGLKLKELSTNGNIFNPIDVLNESLLAEQKKFERRSTGVFHPSEICSCKRKLFFVYTRQVKEESNISPKLSMIFLTGHSLHDLLHGAFKRSKRIYYAFDVPISNAEYEIEAEADCVLEYPRGGHKQVGEFKTINKADFQILGKPKREHLIQINIYMACLKIMDGFIVYLCKDNCEMKWFPVRYDQLLFDEAVKTINEVREFVKLGRLPPINKAHCNFCNFTRHCRECDNVENKK